jgi:release factor glutamine methyltransferase
MNDRVKDLLVQAVERLVAAKDNTAQLDAEVLMMFLLNCSRAQLYLKFDAVLEESVAQAYTVLVDRRVQGEPIAYITTHREFMALDFYVDQRVLVPRPETELLVEFTVKRLIEKNWTEEPLAIADIGTGSGVIAVYLAMRFPKSKLFATDISAEALEVARINANRHEVVERISFLQGNLLEPLPELPKVIVSNPPYTVLSQVEPDVVRYEPNVALDGGAKGLSIYRELLSQARHKIARPGIIALEIGSEQATAVTNLCRYFFPGCQVEVFKDYAGLDRVVLIEVSEENKSAGGAGDSSILNIELLDY